MDVEDDGAAGASVGVDPGTSGSASNLVGTPQRSTLAFFLFLSSPFLFSRLFVDYGSVLSSTFHSSVIFEMIVSLLSISQGSLHIAFWFC